MSLLSLTVACAPYDRVWPIIDGRVKIEGCDITFFPIDAEEAFTRAYRSEDFDVTELSLSTHLLTTSRGRTHYIAIPAFLSRMFRHSAFYIRTDRGIRSPQDLKGKIVGVPEYQMTAAVWARGLLSDNYGVRSSDIRWRNGGLNHPGRVERFPITLPSGFELTTIPAGQTLSDMLERGEIDALITARVPLCFARGASNVARLFPQYRADEEAYYLKTRLFPIMHTLAVRRSLVEEHRWLAPSLLKAFLRAKQMAMVDLQDLGALAVTLPWLADDIARTQAVMGADFWPYGVPANRKELETLVRWSVEQGLSDHEVALKELFAPGTLDNFQLKD